MDLSDTDDNEIETSLLTLKTNASQAETHVLQALTQLKQVEVTMKRQLDAVSEPQLRSKAPLRYWLEARTLSKDCSFQQFFERFLEEHKQEYRLDLTDRSILLNTDARTLFGVPGTTGKLTMTEILERLPRIYQ